MTTTAVLPTHTDLAAIYTARIRRLADMHAQTARRNK